MLKRWIIVTCVMLLIPTQTGARYFSVAASLRRASHHLEPRTPLAAGRDVAYSEARNSPPVIFEQVRELIPALFPEWVALIGLSPRATGLIFDPLNKSLQFFNE